MEREGHHTLRRLIDRIDHYLAHFDGEGIASVREGISRFHEPGELPQPQPPKCGFLDEAVAAIEGEEHEPLGLAIKGAQPFLRWITYDAYPAADIGVRFAKGHAFTSLVGEGSAFPAPDFDLGLFLIAPRIFYRDHHHAAPELYAPLTGPHGWRFGIDRALTWKPAHQPVWNAPFAPHATMTGEFPFLSIFCWTRDVKEPARVITARDWEEIEGQTQSDR
jgi:hypothetical protein